MARLLADENFPLPVVERLRRMGHDVLTMNDIGRFGLGLTDAQVLDEATGDSRAVLTLDRRDFRALHRQRRRHAGIVACTFGPDWDQFARRIDQALQLTPEVANQLILVYQSPTRDT